MFRDKKNGEQFWVKSSKKPVCFRLLSHLASQNQEFPKWASSNQEFLKRAGSNQEFSKVNSSLPVCKNYCACVNVSSGTSLDSWILNCIREFWHLQCRLDPGLIAFQTATISAICCYHSSTHLKIPGLSWLISGIPEISWLKPGIPDLGCHISGKTVFFRSVFTYFF